MSQIYKNERYYANGFSLVDWMLAKFVYFLYVQMLALPSLSAAASLQRERLDTGFTTWGRVGAKRMSTPVFRSQPVSLSPQAGTWPGSAKGRGRSVITDRAIWNPLRASPGLRRCCQRDGTELNETQDVEVGEGSRN